mgnify:CR=1 FL=1
MDCSNCHNNIDKSVNCINCGEHFCSYNCMKSHMILSHKKNMNIPIDFNNSNCTSKNTKNYQTNLNNKRHHGIKSPYIIPGILNIRRINYNEKYNLDNFIPIIENGKPKIIGCGSFGQVFLVMNTINKKLYAIKHMEKKSLSNKLDSFEGIYKEIYIQSRIDHPNILPILYVNETSTDFDLVLEYASGGSLFHYIRRKKYLTEPLAFSLFIQVINAIYFLHKNNFIHRDIKPENILLFDNNIIKLCDFGWCVRLEEGQQRGTFCGTTEYMSPELVNHEEYSKEIDVWSLGILLYEMVHGYSPFRPDKPNFNAKDVIENIRLHKLKFNKNISEECKQLIYHLLDEDPNKRFKVEDIFYSDFVKFYEQKKYALPDKFLIEKYKFKLAKAQSNAYYILRNNSNNSLKSNNNNSNNNIKNKNFINKIIIRKRSEIIKNNLKQEENSELIYEKNNKRILLNKKEIIKPSLSDPNLKISKSCDKKLTKNKTTQYFHPLQSPYNKTNDLLSKSKNDSNHRLINSFNNNSNKENEDCNYPKQISTNENKIKTIIINNYFSNLSPNEINKIKKNEEKKNDYEKIMYKKQLHIKPLKMSKIPIKTKMLYNARSPLNGNNKNDLMIKNHLSPKNIINIKNNKILNFQKDNNIESKYIEVKRNKFFNIPQNNYSNNNINDISIKKFNKSNYNKKTYTRNNINVHYKTTKINYNSDENIININTNNNSHNNDSFTYNNNISNTNSDDLFIEKIKKRKLSCTKSLNHLKVNYNNYNIKSLFISNIKNNINNLNNNSINSEKNYISKKKNSIQNGVKTKGNLNININEKKINTFHTYQNSPQNTFNNNFIYINFNNENNNINIDSNNNSYNINYSKTNKSNINNKDINLNHISSENTINDNPKKNFHKTNLSEKNNKYEEYTKYKIEEILNNNIKNNLKISNKNYYYDKNSKLYNSMSQNSIFNKKKKIRNQKKFIIHNKIEFDKKIGKIPKGTSFKKGQNININFNSKPKIEFFEKQKSNSNNNSYRNYNHHNIFSFETGKIKIRSNLNSNRDRNNKDKIYRKKARNDSNRSNNSNDKIKIAKRLELNEFLNNMKISKDEKNIVTTSNDLNFSTSGNQSDTLKISRINTSINNKNCYKYFESSTNSNAFEFQGNNSLRINNSKYISDSRNFYSNGEPQHHIIKRIKSSNNNNIIKDYCNCELESLNLDGNMKDESKIIISPIIHKQKKDINIFMKRENNINFGNVENKCKNKIKYNQIDNKVSSDDFF